MLVTVAKQSSRNTQFMKILITAMRPVVFTMAALVPLAASLAKENPNEKKAEQPAPELDARTDFSEVPDGWLVGLDRAKDLAAESGRDILLNFSGSDWIPPSIELERRVFTKPEFITPALEKFVLVRLDFPRKRHSQSEALQEANLKAAAHYEVRSHPMVVLADPQGRPYSSVDYKTNLEPELFLKMLVDQQAVRAARDASLEAAEKADGAAKVSHLAKALKELSPNQILRHFRPQFDEIVRLDPDNAGGLSEVVFYEKTVELRKKLDGYADQGKWAEALKELNVFKRAYCKTPQQKQKIDYFRVKSMVELKQYDKIMPLMDKIIEVDPDSVVGKEATKMKPKLMEAIAKAMHEDNLKKKEEAKKKEGAKAEK